MTLRRTFERMVESGKPCRLCLSKDELQTSLFESYASKKHLLNKIESCLQLKIRSDDSRSEYICYECIAKVEKFHEFKRQTIRCQKSSVVPWKNTPKKKIEESHLFDSGLKIDLSDDECENYSNEKPCIFKYELLPDLPKTSSTSLGRDSKGVRPFYRDRSAIETKLTDVYRFDIKDSKHASTSQTRPKFGKYAHKAKNKSLQSQQLSRDMFESQEEEKRASTDDDDEEEFNLTPNLDIITMLHH